jgi:cell division protein FtsN
MKKVMVFGAAVCVAIAFTGCKSSESAYKKAYEKAKAQEAANTQEQPTVQPVETYTPAVTPVTVAPATQTQVVDNGDNITVRQEKLSVVDGAGLKNFSVVVGSFQLKENAEGLQRTLKSQGYDAQVVVNNTVSPAMYRVVATTFDTKGEAAASRSSLMTNFPGAWLLYAK